MKSLTKTRRRIKILMIDLGIDKRGGITRLAKALKTNRNALSMYLSGYREGRAAEETLQKAVEYLEAEKSA